MKQTVRRVARAMRQKPVFASAIVVAAGSARRMNGIDKVLAELGGKPLVYYALRALQDAPLVREIIVVTRPDLLGPVSDVAAAERLEKVKLVVCGGETRTESVRLGLEHVSKRADIVAIHDAARPFVSQDVIERTLCLAAKTGAAAPAVEVKDTIKCVLNHIVTETPDRSRLAAVQTPQCFDRELFQAALQKAAQEKFTPTDDCALMEYLGMSVHLSQGDERNFKVTTPQDLLLAELVLQQRRGEEEL